MLNLSNTHRIWAEIDITSLKHNYRQAARLSGNKKVYAVIKANAYGHGAAQCAEALISEGCRSFAVASCEEAIKLAESGIDAEILIMGAIPAERAAEMAEKNISITIVSLGHAKQISAAMSGKSINAHFKVDTGMARLGFGCEGAVEGIVAAANLPGIQAKGVFSHFAAASIAEEREFTLSQYEQFVYICASLKRAGLESLTRHCSSSDAIIGLQTSIDNAIRPGIMLYGYSSFDIAPLKPVMSLRAVVAQTKIVKKGESVSYNRAWRAPEDSKIAVVCAGYADGLLRSGSSRIEMIVEGQRAQQVGTICMDMAMIDITGLKGVKPGSVATIIGQDGSECINADEHADRCSTIPYEALCSISGRVARHYY